MGRLVAYVCLLSAFALTKVTAQEPDLQLPFMAGDTWWCAQGWDGSVSHSDEAAWDYNVAGGVTDLGYPLVAAANGRVVFAGRSKDRYGNNSAYGNVVLIDYGSGYYGRLAHQSAFVVKPGENVVAGQVVGFCGQTGQTDTQWPSHIHYNTQRTSSPGGQDYTEVDVHFKNYLGQVLYGYPEPCDCSENPPADKFYTSVNHNIFDLAETSNHGSENGAVHWWPGVWNPSDKYDGNNCARRCYLQDYSGGSWGACAIVYDGLGGARKSYTVRTGFWSNVNGNGWSQLTGPQSDLGMPITNEYAISTGARQEFQKGYMIAENNNVTVVTYSSLGLVAPGWTSSGWNNQYSYLFALAYERNGGAPAVGLPSSAIYSYGSYLRQDFSGGSFGNCCIMYDSNNATGNSMATNEAYLLRTGFYEFYQTGGGQSAYGCPTRDEYGLGDPGDAIQFFLKRVESEPQQHHMYYDASADTVGWNSSYATDYVSQNPAGQFTMQRNETRSFTVSFRNTSQFTWHNNSNNYPYDYVELKSCDTSGATCESFLNYPYDGTLGWLNNISPCTMQESSVAPGDVATFTFTGKVAANASLGLRQVYFRVNHSVGGLMTDWGGMHFQVNVVASLPEGYSDIVTVYDYGNQVTRIHSFVNDGDEFDYQGSGGWWQKTGYIATKLVASCVGDFNEDGFSDMAAIYDYPDSAARIHVWLSTGTGLDYQDDTGWWLSSNYETDNVVHMVAGDFNEDGKDDVAIVYRNTSSTTRVHVWLSTGSSFSFQGADGWWYKTAYHADDVVQAVAGDFDNDGDDDIALMYDYGSAQTRIHMLLSSGAGFSWTGSTGWWLSTSYTATNVKHMVAGDFNASGGWDIAMLYYYGGGDTRMHMLLSTGSSFSYQGNGGWWSKTGYNGNSVIFAAPGYFDDDAVPDVALAYRYGASSTRFHVLLSTGNSFNYQGDTGWWLSTTYSLDSTVHLLAGHFNEESSRAYKQGSDDTELPSTFTLNQNYPNPFNPATTISYSLPKAGHVSLTVYNILGQTVSTLVDEDQAEGAHSFTWDASRFSSGIYLYRIEADGITSSKKMLLLK